MFYIYEFWYTGKPSESSGQVRISRLSGRGEGDSGMYPVYSVCSNLLLGSGSNFTVLKQGSEHDYMNKTIKTVSYTHLTLPTNREV